MGSPEEIAAAIEDAAEAQKKADGLPTIICLPPRQDGESRPMSEVHAAVTADQEAAEKHRKVWRLMGLPI